MSHKFRGIAKVGQLKIIPNLETLPMIVKSQSKKRQLLSRQKSLLDFKEYFEDGLRCLNDLIQCIFSIYHGHDRQLHAPRCAES